jgi:tRNA uridine 5-carbamoylmethylation protein Kti12
MSVIILRGISGAGKTTLAKKLKDDYEADVRSRFPDWGETSWVVSSDSFFETPEGAYNFNREHLSEAHNACLRRFTNLVICKTNTTSLIIVDNTNLSLMEMAPYAALASALGHSVEVITVLCAPEVALQRNLHGVTPDITARQYSKLQAVDNIPSFWNPRTINHNHNYDTCSV